MLVWLATGEMGHEMRNVNKITNKAYLKFRRIPHEKLDWTTEKEVFRRRKIV